MSAQPLTTASERVCWAALLLLCCAAACHRGPSSAATMLDGASAPAHASASPRPSSDKHSHRSSKLTPANADTPQAPPTLAPVPADAEPCERSCAAVHGCLLALDYATPRSAASREFACLDSCVHRPSADSERPFPCAAPIEARGAAELLVSCESYLACVERSHAEPPPRPLLPEQSFTGSGCQRACQAFAHCRGLNDVDVGDNQAVVECAELCSETIDAGQERRAGECTELGDCEAIESCIRAIPGS